MQAGIIAGLVGRGGCGLVVGTGFVLCAVVVIEGRNLQQRGRIEGVHPGEDSVAIGFVLAVTQSAGVIELVLPAFGIGIVGDLIVVCAELRGQAKLVLRIVVVNERAESAVAVFRIMNRLLCRRLQPIVAAVAVGAGVPREFFRVVAEAYLVVGLVEVSEAS